ncbi:MAG: [FeFe] hydrogenase H-cluster radical SAM maturase HydG [Nitrospirae bacterium CG_4_9_14_3_um_filter_53_35]|nr:MAG: [FeFe] hydrogenase H-cluster radical SAM maturase HydG [Nitrospirae bacterium CG2_30_53_67]PIS37378.1 MAG: [FeFe] hydrogenase H-cluster radical SAM maturase HydG [Nitrospirae bacterium CG08_land_8_20_14_0_20_52_24]PIV82762.1 MAG: [FeFe] hydrogenase H-cluster radical SAM maturase HydG [Nitrospirae bacterium CG17_big_fil_post_rev_8_21_14_2_50_50_9]PIW85397.1 MAG: [FeFe] hydrogenase H-cluster radical SAM maturase HydG [Nitrospirae bacterium CG_4_8_14_3_um_filter_50_41]PIX85329.1 MAG: [FeFe
MAERVHDLVIDDEYIHSLMQTGPVEADGIRNILDRAARGEGLGLDEAAALLNVSGEPCLDMIYSTAREIKEKAFGKRIGLFAPLYVSNRCINNCLYCGFRRDNQQADRRTLSIPEIAQQAAFLYGKGHRRLLLVAGEDPSASSVEYLTAAVEAVYRETGIRIVHVNAAPMTVEDFSRLKASGAGVYQCFQETYHRKTYERMHPSGLKHDYHKRLSAMDRAMEGGFEDVGMGALLGLYDYRFEVLSLIAHARYLEEHYGAGPHTIAVPRLMPAEGAALIQAPFPVSDRDFRKIVAVYRIAVPYAGVVVSTRESADLRDQVIHLGASQISAGSRTDIGGYTHPDQGGGTSQFSLNDTRSLEEVVRSVLGAGLLPSLCTACYRAGRTGERFRTKAGKGEIRDFCLTHALSSLTEYLREHAGSATQKQFEISNLKFEIKQKGGDENSCQW